jgi:16S rRNA (adenine1518-N6/adenine1519-N6)-dimethyltransferase
MRTKKHLGQHFLTSHQYATRIVDAGDVQVSDTVLEIGPGKGMLTEELLKRAERVIVVEKDADMLPILHEKFETDEKNGKLKIIRGDIRDISLETLGIIGSYKLIANIPYYITGELLRIFLTHAHKPSCIVFLVQKEVAERIVARDKKESLLSLSVKAYGTPKIIATVRAGNFSPPPKVDSAILLIENISNEQFQNTKQEQRFFELIHAGFAHKRKKLKKNLEAVATPERIEWAFTKCQIPENTRAEDVPFALWIRLSQTLD